MLMRVKANSAIETLSEVSPGDLMPGSFAPMFQRGAKAIILRRDPRVTQLWEALTTPKMVDFEPPWDQSLMDVARNHRAGNLDVGDMLRFVPGGISHFARKIILSVDRRGIMRTSPTHFVDRGREWMVSSEVLQNVWALMSELYRCMLPAGVHSGPCGMSVELLKYPGCLSDLGKIQMLLADSGGGWTKFGHRLDMYKNLISKSIDLRMMRMRDWFAWGSMVPGLRCGLHRLNSMIDEWSGNSLPKNHQIIGVPHIDGIKVMTALLSSRDNIVTEVRDQNEWVPLPLTTDAAAVFPSGRITRHTGLQPTWHRIIMNTEQGSNEPCSNLTLCLSVLDAKSTAKIWPAFSNST